MSESTTSTNLRPVRFAADPAKVRAFAEATGLATGSRGRFSAEVIAAYNAEHKGGARYVVGARQSKHVARITVRDGSGKRKQISVDVSKARQSLKDRGVSVPARGRLSTDLLARAVGATLVTEPKPGQKVVKFRGKKMTIPQVRAILLDEGTLTSTKGRIPAALLG